MNEIIALVIIIILIIAYFTDNLKFLLPFCLVLPLALLGKNALYVGGLENPHKVNDNLYIGVDKNGIWYNMEKMTENNAQFWYLIYSILYMGSYKIRSKDEINKLDGIKPETINESFDIISSVYKSMDNIPEQGVYTAEHTKMSYEGLSGWKNFDYKKYDIWFLYITSRKINWDEKSKRSDVKSLEIELVMPIKYKIGGPMTTHLGIQKSKGYNLMTASAKFYWDKYVKIWGLNTTNSDELINHWKTQEVYWTQYEMLKLNINNYNLLKKQLDGDTSIIIDVKPYTKQKENYDQFLHEQERILQSISNNTNNIIKNNEEVKKQLGNKFFDDLRHVLKEQYNSMMQNVDNEVMEYYIESLNSSIDSWVEDETVKELFTDKLKLFLTKENEYIKTFRRLRSAKFALQSELKNIYKKLAEVGIYHLIYSCRTKCNDDAKTQIENGIKTTNEEMKKIENIIKKIEESKKLDLTFPYYKMHRDIAMGSHSFAAKVMIEKYGNIPYMICPPTTVMRFLIRKGMQNAGKSKHLFVGDNVKSLDGTNWTPYKPMLDKNEKILELDAYQDGAVKIDKESPIEKNLSKDKTIIRILDKTRKIELFKYEINEDSKEINVIVNGEQKNSEDYEWFHSVIGWAKTGNPLVTIELDALASILTLERFN